MRYDCGGFTLEIPTDWFDTTAVDQPFTLSKPAGTGALQFSAGLYSGGTVPEVDSAALAALLEDFATAHSLGQLENRTIEQGDLSLAAGSLSAGGRVWYASDGRSVAKITFVWEQQLDEGELQEAEQIVRSLRFSPSDA